ncbi:unnamed protein product [Paramecium pentaurelia]|uniref:Protein kinase domain-containing protein n=1 Tax=Paramecium pentaurelia TaxID=43138 RepID=A0A8S1U1E6_9CILI|nr:unnamed protein product [Paramecium pentaurelia]
MKSSDHQQQNSVSWLLNLVGKFSPKDLEKSNLKEIGEEYMKKILLYPQLQQGNVFSYNQQKQEFSEKLFLIYPNILICQHDKIHTHLILSNCSIQKELIQYKESKTYGLIISNNLGNTYLFFSQFIQYRNWYKLMKQYCKLNDFFGKYKLTDRMLPGIYQCYKKSNNAQFTVQIYKMEDFEQWPEIEEVVHNEIQMLRSIKHQNLLQLRRVYEDDSYLFILYEHFKGESLYNLILTNPLHEVQIASIVYQILQLLKFLDKHQFYHGNLNPLNIIINSNNQLLQIFLINLSFKQYRINDKLDWILNRQIEGFIAPEFYNGVPPNITSDLYSLGVLLYFMTFPTQLPNEKHFDKYEIDTTKIQKLLQKKLSLIPNDGTSPLDKSIEKNISLSELDLLSKLLETNPKQRITISDSMKHHWFVNIKSKIKQLNVIKKKKVELPSLRTIIELRSQSELDLKVQSQLSNNRRQSRLGLNQVDDFDVVPDEGHPLEQVADLDFCQLLRSSTQLRKLQTLSNKSIG